MNEELDNRTVPNLDLQFFGRITASISHEMNNIISIIDQATGLLEDHLYVVENGQPVNVEQLKRVQDKIQHQIQRSVEVIKRMNKFAHSVDEPVLDFNLNEVMDNLADICDRFADLNRVTLLRKWDEKEIRLVSSPFQVQQVVYYILKHSFEITDNQAEIEIRTLLTDNSPTVEIEYPHTAVRMEENEWIERADILVDVLKARLVRNFIPDDREIIQFMLPASVPNHEI